MDKDVTDRCRNCGEPIVGAGKYCSNCGQEQANPVVPFREFVGDVAESFAPWHPKMVQSFGLLLFRPGTLTREYIEGRRASYLLPSRLFIIVNFVFFLLVQRFDPITAAALFEGRLMNANAVERFDDFMSDATPAYLFVLGPLLALWLQLLYVGSRRLYTEHLIFAFHALSFLLVTLVPGLFVNHMAVHAAGGVFVLLYFFVALRRTYGDAPVAAVVRAFALWFLLAGMVFAYVMLLVLIGLFRSGLLAQIVS